MSTEEITNQNAKPSWRKRWLATSALLIITAGVLGYWIMRGATSGNLAGRPVPTPDFDFGAPATGGSAARPGDLLIAVQPDKLENAHLKTEVASAQSITPATAGGLRTTGTVEPNAYKVTPALAIAGGIVREVNSELGDKVGRGQKLAAIFSTELADAQTAYLSMQAEIERQRLRYKRAEQLVEIGAASREEFEEVSAAYKTEQAKLNAARQKLTLLGISAKQVEDLRNSNQMSALISVDSPASGTILARAVNPGEVVTMGKELFRVADLSTVWVIGQIYEKDFADVRAGARAVITAPAFPGRTFSGRVSYVDPRVETQTRTAQIRIEVGNPGEILKLGLFVDVNFGGSAAPEHAMVSVPRGAVQMIGAKQVVFVVTDKPGVIKRELPFNQPVTVEFIPAKAGEFKFACGMDMLRGKIIVLQ